ncbi:MAG: amino acid ABC transporter ATP-binding protein [Lachnospiraceae bacterium]|nr:amino acid ABC transporter ATP-binding protein [Lachnospiraceae bacterium]
MEEVLKIEHLHKRFENINVLEDISLSIKKGETVVIIGPSGCGKSTLLRSIIGLESIEEGKVLFEGTSINPLDKKDIKIRQKIGMVFQSYDLFPHKTILENVILAPVKVQKRKKSEVIEEAEKLLERVGLISKKDNYPRQLSGGQKQRVAIVRALIMHPEVLLFDEVTAALDPEMVREVLDVILDLSKQKRTMLIVTHEMAFAKAAADRIIFMDGGNIVEESIPEEFFNDPKTERAKKFLKTFEFEKEKE